ncbi:16S rRNA (guanine(966)-N(2))-methyltransferase RsmD [Anaerosacchariphilus polymeriproducens]|uniref:16S rRNA (Guanine(966)-N(2))-methyltransferase RsmD n=1 Tax=Anaerosacchariphilus polymeriproducens TaxID=1812858 RepID=A0A371AU51_9FIRM|nr:16S rRNA (guanine(966)-N(2))-methyltransferase RsmD [Anaerosacchariphilus polymeriproducens]RDU23091.1 16S rRNA (guanine(966)-N(2))-methyltransferase RsmD [Anaerosacchariphilus polymeriproducens]
MRVIAGSARSLPLKTIEGSDTRPTTDRIKETLFNMIQNELGNSFFLDLFSGSGAIGIEALSRGAEYAVFVENNKRAVSCIKDNLLFTKLDSRGEIINADITKALLKLEGRMEFDFIFMDPPYNQEYEKRVLDYLRESTILNRNTIIIIESSLETNFSYVEQMEYQILKEKKYKTNKHLFLSRI